MKDERKKPVETLRDGSVKAAVWENEGEKGKFHSVTFSRSYRDKEGNYADTNRFSGSDLLKLSSIATQSYESVQRHRAANKETRPPSKEQAKSQDYANQQRKATQQSRTSNKGLER
ncbi:MAG: hypothetical protein V3V10_04200 [Planctomycetota bacterium]